jgi:hypothetical protein
VSQIHQQKQSTSPKCVPYFNPFLFELALELVGMEINELAWFFYFKISARIALK